MGSINMILFIGLCLLSVAMGQVYPGTPNQPYLNEYHPQQLSTGPSYPKCTGETLYKVRLNQSGYINFIQYDEQNPEMYGFHSCFWINLNDPQRAATALSHYFDFDKDYNNLTVLWTGTILPSWYIQVNGVTIGSTSRSKIYNGTWHHFCTSWSGQTGEWSFFQDGHLLEYGVNRYSIGMKLDAGGFFVSGQLMNVRRSGMDRGAGIDGFITLVHVDSRPLHDAKSHRTQHLVKQLSEDCSATDRGDVVGWIRSPKRAYAGTTFIKANEKCRYF